MIKKSIMISFILSGFVMEAPLWADDLIPSPTQHHTAFIHAYLHTHPLAPQDFQRIEQNVMTWVRIHSDDAQAFFNAITFPRRVDFSPYPIRSRHLSPQELQDTTLYSAQVDAPFFMIGDDALSQHWLKKHKLILQKLHAIGYVVQVCCAERMVALKKLAPHLIFYPLPGDMLADIFHIEHYPLLIRPHHE